MIKGFVTIATGDIKYFKLARNLLRSYRENTDNSYKFALITNEINIYTDEFDDVVLLDNASNSWMDKIELLSKCPYDENIFIDADCLIYNDINYLWDNFRNADDFSCFGLALPLDSKKGWFTSDVKKYYDIHFVTHLHGMLYYIKKGETIDRMYDLCNKIITDYNNFEFKAFNDILADEPVFSLAMAIMNLRPIAREPQYYCFVPYATSFHSNYLKRNVHFENPTDGEIVGCDIVHWGNKNTELALYKSEKDKINYLYKDNKSLIYKLYGVCIYKTNIIYYLYITIDKVKSITSFCEWVLDRVYCKMNIRR